MLIALVALLSLQTADLSGTTHADPVPTEIAPSVAAKLGPGVSPATLDMDPAPLSHDGTVDLSRQTIGGKHPAVLSIDPPATTAAALSSPPTNDISLKSIVMEIPVAGGQLRFGLVLMGKIEA